ncbi:hypothetical protein IFM89_022033 [Coptis chinensis]|uniref:PARP-type domain-containing protein n=1 Tax=Coptis chinensis TaxID=261450 RepID=A0A835I6X4_9MAGN|nr:hypothetical protein IFM89_022033 [Coptis chinensis]
MGTPGNRGNPWKADYAKSPRALCRTCNNRITKDLDDVEGIYSLRWEDQEMIRKYIEVGVSSSSITTVAANVGGIEVSHTLRATCRRCSQKIMKEGFISTKPEGQGARGVAWHHASCFMESTPSTKVEKLAGWESLFALDQEAVCSLAKKGCSTNKSGGMKRKRSTSDGQKSKVHKSEENVLVGDLPNTSDMKINVFSLSGAILLPFWFLSLINLSVRATSMEEILNTPVAWMRSYVLGYVEKASRPVLIKTSLHSEKKTVNPSFKAGKESYDPFSRRWTKSRNYFVSNPVTEDSKNSHVAAESLESLGGNGAAGVAVDQGFWRNRWISFGIHGKETKDRGINWAKDTSWISPPSGWVKENFDAVFVNDGTHATLAVVGRDYEGRASSRLWKYTIFEGDVKEFIDACRDGTDSAP